MNPSQSSVENSHAPRQSTVGMNVGFASSTDLPIVNGTVSEQKQQGCCGGGCGCGPKMPLRPVTTDTVAGTCESCGQTSQFAPEFDGKIAECPNCREFLDVGELGWELTDFGEPLD